MTSLSALRRAIASACLFVVFFVIAVPSAMATHLRGGTLSWKVVSTTSTTYTVQFTFTESQRWSYPNNAGICTSNPTACLAVGAATTLEDFIGSGNGAFYFGDGTTGNPSGTVTSVNQANDYATATFVFTHTYSISAGSHTAYFNGSNRITTLKLGSQGLPENIGTLVSNYSEPSPVAATPAILAVPLQNSASFSIASAVTDIDPNVNLVYRLSTIAEMLGSTVASVPCPGGPPYTVNGVASMNPPGLTVSSTGIVTWDETQIAKSLTNGNCGFGTPVAGDLWAMQVTVEAHNKTTNAIVSTVPVDLMLEFVTAVGALPTVTLSPAGTQAIEVSTPVSFNAFGYTSNLGSKVTLTASGVPAGATVTGLNATVSSPAVSSFSWTPTSAQIGTYIITYTVTDSNLQQAQASKTIVVAQLPTISCPAIAPVVYGTSAQLLATLFDPSNESLNLVWSLDGTPVITVSSLTAYPSSKQYASTLNLGAAGTHVVTGTATDPHGVSVSCTNTVQVIQAIKSINFPQPPNQAVGTSYTLTATTSNVDPVVYSVVSGLATIAGSVVTYTGSGSVVLAADSPATTNFLAAPTQTATVAVSPLANAYVAPATSVATKSPTQVAWVNFVSGGTLASINVNTQGATGLDFNPVSGGTCTVGTAYLAGQVCSVEYSFTPTSAGTRLGGIVLTDSLGNVLGTSYLSGIGNGALGLFTSAQQTLSVSGLSIPRGLSVDGSGNVYVLETGNGNVDKLSAGSATAVVLQTLPNTGSGATAVDGAGNLFVNSSNDGTIYEFVGGQAPAVPIASTCGGDDNLEVDGAGNLYYSCIGTGEIDQVNSATRAVTTLYPGNLGHRFIGLAADAAGNIYAPDFNTNALFELPAGSAPVPTSLVTLVANDGNLSNPHGVAVDPAGNIYVTNDTGNSTNVLRYAAGTYAFTLLPAAGSRSVILDGAGNLYTILDDDQTVAAYSRTMPAPLTFALTPYGSTADPGQAIEFENDGNAPLLITSYAASANFGLTGSSNTCAVGPLPSGASCYVGAVFTPTTVASLSGSATITDNTLGVVGTQQVVLLAGTAIQAPITITGGSGSSVYDGTVQTPPTCTVTGSFTGDVTCANTPATVGPDATTATIVPAASAPDLAYFNVTAVNGSYTIAQAASVTTVSCPASVTYNGTAQAPCTAKVTGVGGLSQAVTVLYTLNQSVGLATASASFAGDLDHLPSAGSATFTIAPAALSIAGGSYSGVYDGSAHALSACTISVNPDGLTCQNNPAGPVGPDVGSGGVTPVVVGSTANYTVTATNGAWSITPMAVTLTAGSYTGSYDAATHAVSACSSTYPGVACANTPPAVGPNVGSGAVAAVPSFGSGGPQDYFVTSLPGSYAITPAATVTTLACPASVTYSGTAQTPCTATVTGAGGLSQAVPVSYTANVTVGTATSAAQYAGDANHAASSASSTFAITPALLTAKAGSYTGVYDGAAHLLTACVVGANPDGITCANSPVTSVGPDVGSGTVAPVLTGNSSNYTVTLTNGSWSITPQSVTVTAGSYSGVYDGASHAPSACTSSAAGVTCTNSPASVGPAVGTGTVNALVGFASGIPLDYAVTSHAGSYTITKAAASVTPNAAQKTYGAADPVLTGTLTGFVPGDGVTATYSRTAGQSVAGSPYTITAMLAANPALSNYNITYNTAPFTINKLAASVTAAAATKVFGTADPALTGSLSGFLPADGVTATFTRVAGESVAGSPYAISGTLAANAAAGNYAVTYVPAAFLITKATPTVTWTMPASIKYGTLLSATQLNAKASVAGTFLYNPAAGALLTGGTQTLSATFTPTDSADLNTVTATTTIMVQESTVSLGLGSGTETYPTWNNFVLGPAWSGNRPPTGTVTLYNNGVAIITLPLGGDGKAYYTTSPPLNAGVNNLTVYYSGDSVFPPGLSGVTTITVLPAQVNFQATCEGAQVYSLTYVCQVNLSASTPTPPVGNITYSYDGSAPVPVAITFGNAGFVLPGVPTAGTHTLAISYAGQGNYAAVATLQRGFTTQQGQTQLQIFPSTYYTAHGSAVTLSGFATTPLSGVPSGAVTFYDNGAAIGTASIGSNGAVSFAAVNVSKGQHTYSATYAGTTNYAAATSGSSTITSY